MGETVTLSGAENEAIVVAESVHDEEGEREGEREREEVEAVEGEKEKQCSGCRTVHTIDQFQGTDKNAGKIMRTCMGCRAKYEKLVVEKICSDCRTQQPLDQFQGSGKRFEGKEMRTCSTCRSRRDYRDVSFMSTRSSEGTKKSLMPEVGYVRDTRRNRLGENRRQMLDKIAKQMVDNGNTFTDKHWKDITESQKLTAWEIPQVKKYIENAMENIEKARKKDKVAAAPPGRKTANSSSSSSSAAEPTPKSSPQPTTSKELTTTRMKPVTRGQTEQVAPRRRLTNNSNQTSIASIAAEFRETPSHQATSASAKGSTSSAPAAKNPVRKNAGVSTPTFIKIDDDTASEAEASDRDVREVQSKAKSPPQTRTQSKHTTPASVTRSSTSKKRSTPPPSSSSIDTEDTYQSKRLRTQQSERESERQREEEEGEEESNPRADLEAFANSLERLSRLLFAARDNLSRKQVGVLENDIHHDWKVDEMSTFVEGFLRGADALDGRVKD